MFRAIVLSQVLLLSMEVYEFVIFHRIIRVSNKVVGKM